MPTQLLSRNGLKSAVETYNKRGSTNNQRANEILYRDTLCDAMTHSSSDGTSIISEKDIDNLSDKFDSVDLTHNTESPRTRYESFEMSGSASGIDVNETLVQCRGLCVDVNKVYKQDEDGDTLLHVALITMAPELVFFFIDMTPHFSWLNLQNKLSQSPLHLAVLTNQPELVRRLVVGGANLESRDRNGNMAIHLACRESFVDALLALLKPVRYDEQKKNNYDIPFRSIPQNLEAKNYEGLTCLHIASLLDNIDAVKILVDNGADVNSKAAKSGRTILHEAAWSGRLVLVKYLVSLGNRCNINAKTYDGYTAFDYARSREHWGIVLELATTGASSGEDME